MVTYLFFLIRFCVITRIATQGNSTLESIVGELATPAFSTTRDLAEPCIMEIVNKFSLIFRGIVVVPVSSVSHSLLCVHGLFTAI